MINVAFVNYSLFGGGAERNAINLSHYLCGHGVKSDIVLFKDVNEYACEYGFATKTAHVIPLIKSSLRTPLLLKPFHFILLVMRLYTTIRKNKYDILIGVEEYDPFYLTVLLARMTGTKSLLIAGNNIHAEISTKNIFLRPFFEAAFYWSFRFCDRIVSLSKGLTADLMRNYSFPSHKIVTIYSGVSSKDIAVKSKQPLTHAQQTFFRGRPVIVSIGRLVDKKGFGHLIRAFALIKKSIPSARLMIIGKGPRSARLKKLASYLKIDHSVSFRGFVKDNPYKLLKNADVFAFTSLYEGFGNTIIEAMNCRLPIVSMDCPYGPHEIISNKYGILSPAIGIRDGKKEQMRKEQLFAQRIINLVSDKEKMDKLSRISALRARSFTIDIMGKSFKRALEELAKEK